MLISFSLYKWQKHQEFVRCTNCSGSLWILALPRTFKRWGWFVPTLCTCIHSAYQVFHMLKTFHVTSISLRRGPSLLLGPESIRTTWARNERTEHSHTPNHSVSAGHSFCSDISWWWPQLCPHSLRSGVWLGAQQVWSAGSQWQQWWVVKTLNYCTVTEHSNPQLRLIVRRSFSDRFFPALLKSLRSQRVIYISCGEDHTAALTKVSYILFGYLICVICGWPLISIWIIFTALALFL